MANEKTILITGATGKQGGATLRHLAKRGGFKLRAMTRKPDSDAAKALSPLGAEVVAGDLERRCVARARASRARGASSPSRTPGRPASSAKKSRASASRSSRATRACSTSSTARSAPPTASTGIPHFDNKFRVEETIKQLKFPSHVILRPVFFMENLPRPGSSTATS